MVTIAQLDFDHLYIPRTTQGQPWPLALGSGFLISPTDPGPAGPRDLASPTDRARDFVALQGQGWP